MPDHPVPAEVEVVAQPGGELHQGLIAGVGEHPVGVGMADLDGDGVPVALVGGGGLLIQGDTLNDLSIQADEEMGADLGVGVVVKIPVLLGGGAGVAHIVDGNVVDLLNGFPPASTAVDPDQLDVHPGGDLPVDSEGKGH